IKQRAGFRLAEVEPQAAAEQLSMPALYLHAERDGFVLPDHSRDLVARHKCEAKQLVLLPGEHNGVRGVSCFEAAAKFLFDHLLTPDERTALVTVPRLNLISSTLYYVVRVRGPTTA